MNIRQNVICVAACLCVQATLAENHNIVGAFGIEFGDTLPDEAKENCGDRAYCPVKPEAPYYSFDSYQVRLTETKNRIYEIVGSGEPESLRMCNAQAEAITRILAEKYGIEFEATEVVAPNGLLANFWTATIGTPPPASWPSTRHLSDTTTTIGLECRDYTGMEGWEAGGMIDLAPVTITITYKSNAVIATENLELRLDKRGL